MGAGLLMHHGGPAGRGAPSSIFAFALLPLSALGNSAETFAAFLKCPTGTSTAVVEVLRILIIRVLLLISTIIVILMRLAYRPIEKGTIVLFILINTSFAGRFERPRKQE